MATTVAQTTPAFLAFESQLKTLCLKEFPCGNGTWRETKPSKLQKLKKAEKVDSRFSVTLKDFGAKHEKTETLEEYVSSTKSPWHLDYSWSNEARQLREISVKSPWLIDNKFVLNHFKTLRIVNKDVTDVDANLLQFTNLEELTLSCNFLSKIASKNLPPNLKVLEVCANEISDLSSLCTKPPRLIHLGLGFNKVSIIGDYLTAAYWPCLLSLDLSNNNLSDLLDAVRKLSSLPKLRNLVLQGNPLSLIPGYRGYTVDSLKKLSILDDIMISADERHYFKGLARRREYILDEAKVHLSVTYIKGVPMPEEMKNPEDQPEFPVIERKYYVQFKFLEDASPRHETFIMNEEDLEGELPAFNVFQTEGTMDPTPEPGMGGEDDQLVEKNVAFTQEPHVLHTIQTEATGTDSPVLEEKSEHSKDGEEEGEDTGKGVKVSPVNSEGFPWAEDIECNWTKTMLRDDLVALRDFFKQGMEVSVVEEMAHCYPVIPEEGEEATTVKAVTERIVKNSPTSSCPNSGRSSGRKSRASSGPKSRTSSVSKASVMGYPVDEAPSPTGKSGGKEKKDKKEKDEKPKVRNTSGGKEKGGDKKKKKEPEVELKKNPPTFMTLATWHMPLLEFLEGEFEFQSVFSQGGVQIASSTIQSRDTDSARRGTGSRASSRRSRKERSIKDSMDSNLLAPEKMLSRRSSILSNSRAPSRSVSRAPSRAPSRSVSRAPSGAPSRSMSKAGRGLAGSQASFVVDIQSQRTSRSHSRSTIFSRDDPAKTKKSKDGRKADPKDKDKNKKPGSAKRKDDKSKERKPSAGKSGKGDKGDKGKAVKGASGAVEEEEDTGPPPPLEIQVSVKLHHWKTAMDLLRDEEEKKRQEEEEEAAKNNNNTETE